MAKKDVFLVRLPVSHEECKRFLSALDEEVPGLQWNTGPLSVFDPWNCTSHVEIRLQSRRIFTSHYTSMHVSSQHQWRQVLCKISPKLSEMHLYNDS